MKKRRRTLRVSLEPLEPRLLLAANLLISEFMADNDGTLVDARGNSPDWIEIHNAGDQAAQLEGWYLTDRPGDLTRWKFPSVQLPPDGYLVVFASGQEEGATVDAGGNLHANFRLARDGDYLALVQPDGKTVASALGADGQDYPQQFEDVAYGTGRQVHVTRLVGSGDQGRMLIPHDDSLGTQWTRAAFADENWTEVTTGMGFVNAIDDLAFWLAADHLTDLRSGDSVGAWPDSSGHGHVAAQSSDRRQPTWVDNVIGDRPVIRFDGIDDILNVDSLHIGSNTSVFIVARNNMQSSRGGSPRYLLAASSDADRVDGDGYGFGYGGSRSPGFRVVQGQGQGGSSKQAIVDRAPADGGFEIVAYRKSGQAAELWRDGLMVATGSQVDPVGGYATGYTIGADPREKGHAYRGDIAELLVFRSALPDEEFAAVSKYLEETYDLAARRKQPRLVSYWNFDDQTVDDSIGPNDGMALMHGATLSDDVPPAGGTHSLDLTAPKAYVTLPSADYGITNQYTVSAWVKRDGAGSGRFFAARRDLTSAGSDRSGIALGLSGDKLYAGLISSSDDDTVNTGDTFHDYSTRRLTVPEGQWTHVAVTLKDDVLRLYVNGVAETTYDPGGGAGHPDGRLKVSGRGIDFVDSDGSFSGFGADGSAPADSSSGGDFTRSFFDGWLDEVAVWNTALTPEAVARLGQGQPPPSVPVGGAGLPDVAAADMDAARLAGIIKTDVRDQLLGSNGAGPGTSAYLRIPFAVDDPAPFSSLQLRVRYDDGFVAYLNGTEIARRNVDDLVAWDSTAATERGLDEAVTAEPIDVSQHLDLLTAGQNLLALQGLNYRADDPDFLLDAELVDADIVDAGPRYFLSPTPGAENGSGINNSGPGIDEVSHRPSRPTAEEDLVVSARITAVGNSQPLRSARLTYRVMYGEEKTVPMVDDGSGPDAAAGDGIFTAAIPAESYQDGDMVRYYISTLDAAGNPARKPEFLLPTRSAQYFGTVVIDATLPDTKLPVLEWFVEDPSWYLDGGGNSRDWTFASIYYNGHFYDNIRARVRGGVTQNQAKPNLKFDFYSGGRFQHDPDEPNVEEFNLQSLMGEMPIRTYMRDPLAYQLFRDSGHAAPFSFYTHVRQNGEFYALAAVEEQIDQTFLKRHGLDPEGALYKASSNAMLQTDPTAGQWEKVTRLDEDYSDLAALTEGLALTSSEERTRFVFDQINIPQVIHFLAVSLLGPHHDRITHNYYMYRDTNGTGQWSIFPWDMDRFFPQGDLLTNPTAIPIFYGDSDHPRWPGAPATRYNRLNDAIFDIPQTRQMFVTHLRSVVDQWMNTSYLEDSVDAIEALITPDARLDNAKWHLGSLKSGVRAIKNTIATRRRQLADDPDFKPVGIPLVTSGSATSILVPTNDDLGTRWTTPAFVEGEQGERWTAGNLSVGFDRGTALDALIETDVEPQLFDQQKSVFLRTAFEYSGGPLDKLLLRIAYDDAFVAYLNGTEVARSDNLGPGTPPIDAEVARPHNAKRPEEFDISAFQDQLRVGGNVLAIHGLNIQRDNRDLFLLPQLIAIPRADLSTIDIAFGAVDFAPASGNQDEEYVTLVNQEAAAIDISGWKLSGGIDYAFQPGTVIPARGTLYVSPNVAALLHRSTGPSGGQSLFVQGDYQGHISSRGETIELRDGGGKLVASVTTPASPSKAQRYLRVTELHYNPPGADDSSEFIELRNISDTETLDLKGVRITGGPSKPFSFAGSNVTSLGPGQFVLVVKDLAAFRAAYPEVDDATIAGAYQGSLSNRGERIKIEDAENGTILAFRYEDGRDQGEQKWPTAADGEGFSLVAIDENLLIDSWNVGSNWRISAEPGGSPGVEDVPVVHADFSGDGLVTAVDIDLLSTAVRAGDNRFDLNNDGTTDSDDHRFMIETVLKTTYGDSDLDRVVSPLDFVSVLQSAEYEDTIDGNSGWADGDWNGDGDFNRLDLILLLQNGTFVGYGTRA